MLKLKLQALYVLLVLGLLAGCKDREEVMPDRAAITKVNNQIYELMKVVYLWDDQLPASFDGSKYATSEEALDALTYKTYDRWSYLEDLQTFNAYFEGGEYVGNGFGMKRDAANNLWITYVYPGSPAARAGLGRGFRITKVNGQEVSGLLSNNTFGSALGEDRAGVQTQFSLVNPAGVASNVTLTKEPITISSVLAREVKTVGNKKVGYLLFTTFIDKSNTELDEAFSYFKAQGIDELVLDLRYNGGGSLAVAQHMAGLIAPGKVGQKFVELTYNLKNRSANKPFNIEAQAQGINLNRLFVITTNNTASASEAIINGLRPYMSVVTVGAASHGKPVGMNAIPISKTGDRLEWKNITKNTEGYAFLPIMFKVANASGQAEYFEGISADGPASDEVAAPLGDLQEDSMEQVLYYIQNGSFSGPLAAGRGTVERRELPLPIKGLRAEINAF